MPPPDSPDAQLAALRVDIDRIDAAMHGLLIERGGIIERLIEIKGRQGGGSAFRPDREAEMMRRLAERHRGPLPLDTVESIWRVIISSFTFVQAPYAVHAAGADATESILRDTARFHFGFTVPLRMHADPAAALAAVAASEGDLGLLPVQADAGHAPWWPALAARDAPRVIARLPFVERDDHPASLPVFILARPGAAVASRDVAVLCLRGSEEALDAVDASSLVARAPGAALAAVPQAPPDIADRWSAEHPALTITEIGSHAARYTFDASASA